MSLCGVDVGVEDDILVGDVWIEVFSAGRLQGSAMSKVDCTDVSGASVDVDAGEGGLYRARCCVDFGARVVLSIVVLARNTV